MAKTKFFETDSFKQEQNEWYAKIKQEGFEDIEAGENEALIQPQIFKSDKGIEYYQFCQAVLRQYPFKRDIDRAIFELHAEGRTEREIVTWLSKHSFKQLSQKAVNLIINRVKEDFLKMKS